MKGNIHVKVTWGYILKRPDIANGEAVQTYHVNITTMTVDSVPDDQQQIKVFTSLFCIFGTCCNPLG